MRVLIKAIQQDDVENRNSGAADGFAKNGAATGAADGFAKNGVATVKDRPSGQRGFPLSDAC